MKTQEPLQRKNLKTRLYDDLTAARNAVQTLRDNGVSDDKISIVSCGKLYSEEKYREVDSFFVEQGEAQTEEAATVGAGLGGVGGFIVGLTTLLAPGAGPVLIVGGLLLSSATGVLVGGTAGGLFGVMTEIGLSESQAREYSKAIADGKSVVVVQADPDKHDRIEALLSDTTSR